MSVVLIVEDEQHLADGLKFNLEAEGYEVETVGDGETALRLLAGDMKKPKQPKMYDAVVLDVMLPGKDGFEVARELRQAGQYVPILMLTARSRPEDILRGFEAGADDYVPKPFELAILIARLHGLLRRREWLRLSWDTSQPPPQNSPAGKPAAPLAAAWDGTPPFSPRLRPPERRSLASIPMPSSPPSRS